MINADVGFGLLMLLVVVLFMVLGSMAFSRYVLWLGRDDEPIGDDPLGSRDRALPGKARIRDRRGRR